MIDTRVPLAERAALYPELDVREFEAAEWERLAPDIRPLADPAAVQIWALEELIARGEAEYGRRELGDLVTPEDAAALAGVSASTLRRAARRGGVPGLVLHRRGRWELTRGGALAYGAQKRRPGRPAAAGLEVEHVSTFPHRPEWRARIGGGWSYSSTRQGAMQAAHAAERKRRLLDAQRPVLEWWQGAPGRPTATARPPLEAGERVVVSTRGRLLRAVVLDVSRSGRALVAYRAPDLGVLVASRLAAEVLEEVGA